MQGEKTGTRTHTHTHTYTQTHLQAQRILFILREVLQGMKKN